MFTRFTTTWKLGFSASTNETFSTLSTAIGCRHPWLSTIISTCRYLKKRRLRVLLSTTKREFSSFPLFEKRQQGSQTTLYQESNNDSRRKLNFSCLCRLLVSLYVFNIYNFILPFVKTYQYANNKLKNFQEIVWPTVH